MRVPGSARLASSLAAGALSGCSQAGAPSLSLFGAFFPSWLACALIGVAAAVGFRAVLLALGLGQIVPMQLAVCISAGVVAAIAAATLLFGF